ncbi:MAG: 30S ribosomal protein S6 [Elusimicrobia bacterium]|nr:30S ribosomal protein S6 [Elusimicrobiota bacterium]
MAIYETVVVVKPQLSDAEIATVVEKTKKIISNEGGEILNEDKWGRRKLAYQIKHNREGFYVYLKYSAGPSAPIRLDSHFKVQEPIIRTLTVRQEVRRPITKKVKKPKVA